MMIKLHEFSLGIGCLHRDCKVASNQGLRVLAPRVSRVAGVFITMTCTFNKVYAPILLRHMHNTPTNVASGSLTAPCTTSSRY